LHRRRGDYLLDDTPAFGAFLRLLVGKLLDFFKTVAALLAQIFVERHV
jgi:hypothetical protein